MFKLIFFNLLNFILIISCTYALPQSNRFSLIANHNPHLFHQPNHQPNHQSNHHLNHFSTQLHSRPSQDMNNMRSNHLLPSASSPKSSIINTRSQENRPQFSQSSNFKPITRSQVRQPNQKKMTKQQHSSHKNHAHLQSRINWGRCPMLQPSVEEKMKKAKVISKCLEVTPVPENITRESIEIHRELVAACALKEEGWFTSAFSSDESASTKINVSESSPSMLLTTNLTTTTIDSNDQNSTIKDLNSTATNNLLRPVYVNETKLDQTEKPLNQTNFTLSSSKIDKQQNQTNLISENKHSALESDDYLEEDLGGYSAIFTGQLTYNYGKAEREIRSKKFDPDIEEKVIEYHESCKEEAQDKFSSPIQIIGQIQLYQSCMDHFISNICGIEVTY